jgi:hypothetical protein
MPVVERVLTTQSQSITNYDYSKLFLTNFKAEDGNMAASGADIVLVVGMVLGRIAATGKIAISKSAVSDGSEIPLGICVVDQTIADGENADISFATVAKADATKLVFDGTDTLDTVVTSQNRTFRDLIPASTEGIQLENLTQLAEYDNQ